MLPYPIGYSQALANSKLPRRSGNYEGHQGAITSVGFAPDGNTVFTASADMTVLTWDVSEQAR